MTTNTDRPARSRLRRVVGLVVLVVIALGGARLLERGPVDVTLKVVLRSAEPTRVRRLDVLLTQGGDTQRSISLRFDAAHPATRDIWHPTSLPRGRVEATVDVSGEGGLSLRVERPLEVRGSGAVLVLEI